MVTRRGVNNAREVVLVAKALVEENGPETEAGYPWHDGPVKILLNSLLMIIIYQC